MSATTLLGLGRLGAATQPAGGAQIGAMIAKERSNICARHPAGPDRREAGLKQGA